MKRNRRRRPHSPTRSQSKGIALIIARQVLTKAHKQLPSMSLPEGANRREVMLEFEKLMAAYDSRLQLITGRQKDKGAPV